MKCIKISVLCIMFGIMRKCPVVTELCVCVDTIFVVYQSWGRFDVDTAGQRNLLKDWKESPN